MIIMKRKKNPLKRIPDFFYGDDLLVIKIFSFIDARTDDWVETLYYKKEYQW